MQDRFKYRFWDKKNNLMINPSEQLSDGEYIKIEGMYLKDEWYITPEITLTDSLNYFDNRPFEIMQCTGLKDKNGKLIYEGDIIEIMHSMGKKAVVYWDNEKCCFKLKGKKIAYNALITIRNDYFEIIGNICENQELLKEGE